MSKKTSFLILEIFVVLSLVITACAPATPVIQTVQVEVTKQVQVPVEVTKIVAGTPQVVVVTPTTAPLKPASPENPVTLRIGVSMTPIEMETFMPLLDKIQQAHKEWSIIIEQTPQSSQQEKLNANAAAGTLPDVVELVGPQDIMYKGALVPMEKYTANIDMKDFWPGVLPMYTVGGKLMGLPFVSAPEILFYNIDMFDKAKLAYPTNDWTLDQLRDTAVKLTLDNKGRNAADPAFDAKNIKQWGFNTNPGTLSVWGAQTYVLPWGVDFCADPACSQLNITGKPEAMEALNWWYDFVVTRHAALADPYSGAQTGVPGDPFAGGFTAMGYNGYFGIGQIKTSGNFKFGVVQPPAGPKGHGSSFSARAYGIALNSKYPDESWKLIQELTSPEFLANMWAKPGHSVPARKSAAQEILKLAAPPSDLSGVLKACEYAQGFKPAGPGSFEALIKTLGIGAKVFSGAMSVKDGYAQMETEANAVLKQAAGK